MRRKSTTATMLSFFAMLATTSLYAFDLKAHQPAPIAPKIESVSVAVPRTKYRRGRRIIQQLFFPIRPLVRWSSRVLFHRNKSTIQHQTNDQDPSSTRRNKNSNNSNYTNCPSRTIQRFVNTVHSPFGSIVLRKLFPDHNKDGVVDGTELQSTLDRLHLSQLNAHTIVADADRNGNGAIDLSEWLSETPRALRAFCASSS